MNDMHLTEAQLDDALIDPASLSSALTDHLAICKDCTTRLREAQAPLAAFGTLSLAWSERRSATLPPAPMLVPRSAWRTPVAAVFTAAVAVLVALPTLPHHTATATVSTANVIAVPSIDAAVTTSASSDDTGSLSPEDAQISRDNRMLRAVGRQLDAEAATPAALDVELELQPTSNSSRPILLN